MFNKKLEKEEIEYLTKRIGTLLPNVENDLIDKVVDALVFDFQKWGIIRKSLGLSENFEMEIVLNVDFGGFSLSDEAVSLYRKLSNIPAKYKDPEEDHTDLVYGPCNLEKNRTDPFLVEVVKTLGEKANRPYSNLRVEKLYSRSYYISDYDGKESIRYT